MIEIEVRARIKSMEEIKNILVNKGAKFKDSETQKDYYFKLKGKEKEPQQKGSFIIRLRQSKNNFMTYKELTSEEGAWIEHEVEIKDIENMKNILEKMGYTNVLTINKTRTKGIFNQFNLCIDNINELGHYIEIELCNEDTKEAKQKIISLLKEIGIDQKDIEERGYARILFERQGVKYGE